MLPMSSIVLFLGRCVTRYTLGHRRLAKDVRGWGLGALLGTGEAGYGLPSDQACHALSRVLYRAVYGIVGCGAGTVQC